MLLSTGCRSLNEKKEFYELMDKVVTIEKVLVSGDINGHVESDVVGFGEVYGGFWVWANKGSRKVKVDL